MPKNTKLLAAALIGLGMLLGYAAASGKLNPFQRAEADSRDAAGGPGEAATSPARAPGGCCDEVGKDTMLAQRIAQNRQVEEEARSSRKKPNILVIWGGVIGY